MTSTMRDAVGERPNGRSPQPSRARRERRDQQPHAQRGDEEVEQDEQRVADLAVPGERARQPREQRAVVVQRAVAVGDEEEVGAKPSPRLSARAPPVGPSVVG